MNDRRRLQITIFYIILTIICALIPNIYDFSGLSPDKMLLTLIFAIVGLLLSILMWETYGKFLE